MFVRQRHQTSARMVLQKKLKNKAGEGEGPPLMMLHGDQGIVL
jgi:hypothetical protein